MTSAHGESVISWTENIYKMRGGIKVHGSYRDPWRRLDEIHLATFFGKVSWSFAQHSCECSGQLELQNHLISRPYFWSLLSSHLFPYVTDIFYKTAYIRFCLQSSATTANLEALILSMEYYYRHPSTVYNKPNVKLSNTYITTSD